MDRIHYLDTDKLFPNARSSSWEYVPIEKEQKWGLMHERGETVIPCLYDKPIYWKKFDECIVFETINPNYIITTYLFNLQGKILCRYSRPFVPEL